MVSASPICFSVAAVNTVAKSNCEEERLFLQPIILGPSLSKVRTVTQAETEAKAMEGCCLLAHSLTHAQLSFLYSACSFTSLGVPPPTVINQDTLLQTWSQANLIRAIPQPKFCLYM